MKKIKISECAFADDPNIICMQKKDLPGHNINVLNKTLSIYNMAINVNKTKVMIKIK